MLSIDEALEFMVAFHKDIRESFKTGEDIELKIEERTLKVEVSLFMANITQYRKTKTLNLLYVGTLDYSSIRKALLDESYIKSYDIHIPELDRDSMINAYLDLDYTNPRAIKNRIAKMFKIEPDVELLNLDITKLSKDIKIEDLY